jgi:hypothetical protein
VVWPYSKRKRGSKEKIMGGTYSIEILKGDQRKRSRHIPKGGD